MTFRRRLTQWFCALWIGHANLLVVERGRLFVECQICGCASKGWDVEFRSPQTNVVAFHRRRA